MTLLLLTNAGVIFMDAGGEQERREADWLQTRVTTSQPLCLFYIEWGFILSFVALLYFQAANNPWLAVSHPACN